MAEFVELQTEEMVPELEKMKRLRVFTQAEIRKIIRNRRKFQYKINKRTKCVDDYVKYIQYEKDLLMLVKTRKRRMGIGNEECDIDMTIACHINKLFKQAIFQFRDDINLWLSYMKFCKQVKVFSVCMSYMLGGMLAIHGHKPSLWKLAATWEFEENKSIENACQFLLRGLRHHPDSKILYMEAFRLELIYADIKNKQLEAKELESNQAVKQGTTSAPPDTSLGAVNTVPMEADQDGSVGCSSQQDSDPSSISHGATKNDNIADLVIDCRSAEFIYQSAYEKINDVSFLISLLNIAKQFSFTENLQARMVKDLLSRFPSDELTWDALARRELEGLHFSYDRTNDSEDASQNREKLDIYEGSDSVGPPFRNEMERVQYIRLRRCFTIYQQGLRRIPTDRMWELYLDALIEINENGSVLRKCKKKLLCSAFQKAHESGHLKEKYYIQWAKMHTGQREELCYLLGVATERYPTSVELWQMRLRFHLCEDEEQKVMAVFKGAIACLHRDPASTLCLWKMLIQYCQTKSVTKVEAVFCEGIRQAPAVSSVLKQMFLEWLVLTKGICTARKAYQAMCEQPPFCHELHQKMASLECLQPEVELPRVIKCYELACEQFGKKSKEYFCNVSSSKIAL